MVASKRRRRAVIVALLLVDLYTGAAIGWGHPATIFTPVAAQSPPAVIPYVSAIIAAAERAARDAAGGTVASSARARE
jgi:hypothetical protein